MTYEFYKFIHIISIGIFLMMVSMAFTKTTNSKADSMFPGILGLLILISGMGLLAKLSIGFPTWVIIKLALWLVIVGLSSMGIRRLKHKSKALISIVMLLFMLATSVAIWHP